MSQEAVRVLLLGRCARGSSHLLWHLGRRGCHCWFAASAVEAVALFHQYKFHVILSTSPMHQATQMMSLLGGSNCSVFYAYPVEQGCWWLPLMNRGQKCFGAPALRSSEFADVLDQALERIRARNFAAPKMLQEAAYDDARAFKVAS
jgi:hypothetical protein